MYIYFLRDKKLPLILKHCFKDVKKQDGENTSAVSAVCITCGKRKLKGSLIAATNFLNHLKVSKHFIYFFKKRDQKLIDSSDFYEL